MPYTLLGGGHQRFLGLSTDPKPQASATNPIITGSTCLEADTGRIFRWDGSSWQAGEAQDDAVVTLLGAIHSELVRLRRATEISVGIDPDEPAG